jgi:glycosyltransferase involved in cell wall biosynthesis
MEQPAISQPVIKMRVLAHVHTLNDADIIDGTIEAVLRQTRPVDAILLVDNASTDATLDQPSVRHTTVLRHTKNLGTSGAVYSGFRFALEHDYDWIWIFDADSVPDPDALQKLFELYDSWPVDQQNETAFLACLPLAQDGRPRHGGLFTRYGLTQIRPAPEDHLVRLSVPAHRSAPDRFAQSRLRARSG